MILRYGVLTFALVFWTSSMAFAGDTPQKSSPRQVEILGTQLLSIHSSIVNQDYDLYVNLPRNYSDVTRKFPVIYLLDGQWDFPLVNGLYGGQYYDGFVPDVITVGVTWGGEHPNYDSLRTRDLTPTTVKQIPQSGNAPKFLAFIKEELIPFIASKFRSNDADRTLMGSSLGGLFTLYTMFHETSLFSRYILTSPAIMWDNGILYKYEESYHAKSTSLPVKLYMAVGGLEGADAMFGKFVDRIQSRHYQGLQMETRILEGMGHSGSKPEGYVRGLQWGFARPSIKLESRLLDAFVGKYRLNPEITVRVLNENDHLVLLTPDSTKMELHAETENDFYMKGSYLFIKFRKDNTGKVTGLHADQFGGGFDLTKED